VRSFLIESYFVTRDAVEVEALARRARAVETTDAIRHLGSVVLLEDEVCLHVFEAPSAAALRRASEQVGLPCERVTETIWAPGSP
jgi:hypothetical protein